MAKILVIDDSAEVCGFLCNTLSPCGHEVLSAENGKVGLELFEKNVPDLVIVDMVMPIMGGREFIVQVRKMPIGKNTPIIIISAHVAIKEVMDLLNVGATYFLKKPYSIEEIKENVERSLLHLK